MGLWLCVIGERDALWWVLREQQMAFPVTRRRRTLTELNAGDVLYLYATRGAFHNPTRDRGRVIGRATVNESLHNLDVPFTLGERVFPVGCTIVVQTLAPRREGVDLVSWRERLRGLPTAAGAYQMALRQPLLRLTAADGRLLDRELAKVAGGSIEDAIETYRR
jgi:hypothetical protein